MNQKTLLLLMALFVLSGCETGVKNQEKNNEAVLSGIVDRSAFLKTYEPTVVQKVKKKSSNKIFSKTIQPGYYLQYAFFAKNKPNDAFLQPILDAGFSYTVLTKHNGRHVLIGPYISYNRAKSKITPIKSALKKQTFVVQVLRP